MKSYQNLILLQNLYRLKTLGFSYSDSFSLNEKSLFELPTSFDTLNQSLSSCHLCDLSKSRTQTMVGFGNPNAKIMFIDNSVSVEQDKQNSYYAGRSGEMLQKMIENVLHLSVEDVYYTHALKCKPLNTNRPSSSEWDSCRGYLHAQIEFIKPSVIVTLGESAYKNVTSDEENFETIRGHVIAFKNYKVVPIYHPSFILRNPEQKKVIFNDLKTIKGCI
jgi:DNA polymerase